jgi:methylmalonyl-CoA mutase C-terminal domain/subunit
MRVRPGTRILLAKTALDGHWRGLHIVATALRDAGFEVVMAGMERIVEQLRQARPELPVFAGGTVPAAAIRSLAALGVPAFPPGSSLASIVECATRLTADQATSTAEPSSHA